MKKRNAMKLISAVAAMLFGIQSCGAQTAPATHTKPKPPASLRLFVFDCGTLHNPDMGRFNLKKEDVPNTDMSMGCYLIAHPKGNLVWDTGAVPDGTWTPTGKTFTQHITLPNGETRDADITKPLNTQMAEAGYAPSDINFIAISHYHYDHTANANEFAGATWLARQLDRDVMFGGGKATGSLRPSTFSALEKSKTIIIKNNDDYDVFGDGTVVLKAAPGHTQGHQVLYLKLAKTGGVVLSGDLYHYFPAEMTLDRVPTFEFNGDQTRASRKAIGEFLKKTNSQIWVQHDIVGFSKLKKSPQYYE